MDIVDVQQLLEVMAHDAAPVVERIQKLLLPSYFPGPCAMSLLILHAHAISRFATVTQLAYD